MRDEPGARPVELDPIIHAPARLKIMMLLAATTIATFNHLARDADLTAGNLGAHLKALENAGYIESRRSLIDLKPRVRYQMTEMGKKALRAYCAALTAAVEDIQRLVGQTDS